ncbi:MAG: alkaline phosphatase PhoX [Gammaproteobacteria bacterium]
MTFRYSLLLIALLATGTALAIPPFAPLTSPAVVGTEVWKLPPGWQAEWITDRNTLSVQPGFQATFGKWDMLDIGGANYELIYLPFETPVGAGAGRYNRDTGAFTALMGGDGSGVFATDPVGWVATNDDFGTIDPAVLTPVGTLLVAEEGKGAGRMFEILNPATATGTADAVVQWLSNIPSVAHEGIKFDSQGRMYFIDEDKSGSVYRFTPSTPGDLTAGGVDVLVVDDFTGNPALDWDDGVNDGSTRTGAATWVEIVDSAGMATTTADPFDFTSRGGRAAADEVNGTPYGRPEDMVIVTTNGEQIIYFATTSERVVYGVNLATETVFEAVNAATTPDNIGNDPVGPGSSDSDYGLDDPDNLEIAYSPEGYLQLFIVEDENPGDIWMATDNDADGVAEFIDLFFSLGVDDSEPSGLRADPRGGFLICIQHPFDQNDSLWRVYPTAFPHGDINGDGIFDIRDLLLLQRALTGQATLTTEQSGRADVQPGGGNGVVETGDLLVLEKLLLLP